MQCPVCHTDNSDANAYCGQCRALLDPSAAVLRTQIEAVLSAKLKDRDVVVEETIRIVAERVMTCKRSIFPTL
jgi:hypothetical protein